MNSPSKYPTFFRDGVTDSILTLFLVCEEVGTLSSREDDILEEVKGESLQVIWLVEQSTIMLLLL